ncbi:MAG: DUF115 domain-containing protein [Spirochaetes bacterium]|nr:DUF115 domain-containing protein [Spirochaetota bacterium]
MSFWESNRKILIEKYPGLLEEITSQEDTLAPEDIKIETALSGAPSLCVKGIYVHSQRDPEREGQRLVQSVASGKEPVVVLGFGLGYAACNAAELGQPVIIVEKYKNLLLKALELRDLTGLLQKKNIVFVIGGSGDGIINALGIVYALVYPEHSEKRSAPAIIKNKALIELDKTWYGAIEEKIRTWAMKDEVNAATLKRFGKRWVRNLSRNKGAIRDYPGISRLENLAAKNGASSAAPVFLAAAGPSLDKIRPMLGEIYKRCIVVAVDTNLRFFVKNGTPPDFVLTVDPQFWNSRHLDRCVSERTALIAEPAVYPSVLNLPFKRIFLCGSLFPFGAFLEKHVDQKGRLGAGGSVATTAWDFARSLGAQEIWIAGLDLAFPCLKTHFKGARFEEISNSNSVRFRPVESWVSSALRDGGPFFARSSSGGQVLTDRRLSLYAAWFENQFSKYPQVRNFGIFQEGLAITGLESADVKTLLALPERRSEIDRRLDDLFSKIDIEFNEPEESSKRSQRYEDIISILIRALKSIKNAAEEGEAIAGRALKRSLNQSEKDKTVKDMDKIIRRITDSEVKEIAGFLFPAIEKEEDSDPFKAYLKSSLKLFSSLSQSAGFNLEYIMSD